MCQLRFQLGRFGIAAPLNGHAVDTVRGADGKFQTSAIDALPWDCFGINGRGLRTAGIDGDGYRQVLGVEMANRESRSSWKDFLLDLKARGLRGVELVVSDDHAGLVAAIGEVLSDAAWQRCYVHFLRNALDHLPRKHADDCLQELRWIYDRRDLTEARVDLAAWLAKWGGRYPRLSAWARKTSSRRSPSFACPGSTTSTSSPPTCWSASTRRFAGAPTWRASS